jgi:metacaspase-1
MATKAAMMAAIGDLINQAAKGDSLIITYSGHGTWVPDKNSDVPDGRDEAFCPCDLSSKGALLDDDIHALFSRRAAGVRIVLIADSCHSGSVTRGSEEDLDPGVPRIRFMPPEAWMPKEQLPAARVGVKPLRGGFTRSGGDLLLADCMDTEYSYDTNFKGRRPNRH